MFWDNQVRKQTGGAIYWIPNSEDIHLSKVEIYLSGVGESHLIPAKILPKALAHKFYLSSYSGTGKANVSIFLHYCSMVLVISSCQHQDNIGLQQSLLPPALKVSCHLKLSSYAGQSHNNIKCYIITFKKQEFWSLNSDKS